MNSQQSNNSITPDSGTAAAFSNSWNNLPIESVYSKDQFIDWFLPLTKSDFQTKKILELGCGNGSLLVHVSEWGPHYLEGVDLGDSVKSAELNLAQTNFKNFKITQYDLTKYQSQGFDLVYCIGVLHHLKNPQEGFTSVINNTIPGGHFHCWVYAKEGNALIIWLVDPIRKITSRLPWQITKYFISNTLGFIYYLYAHFITKFKLKIFPLYKYSVWITKREFSFFRHVVFDQLVTPQTVYLKKETLESWMKNDPRIDLNSTYLIFRNGNSWKFGGLTKSK
jgi:SAM-dependent methyltransferase